MSTMPTFFISHGGGPWPWIAQWQSNYAPLKKSLQQIVADLPAAPKAIVVVTAHWVADTFKISSAAQPSMIYDYYGFPAHTYQIDYPARGESLLARQMIEMLQGEGVTVHDDPERGFDHGSFVPLSVMFPQADIPVVQCSIRSDYDIQAHYQLGQSLQALREQGVLIIGSGLTYHNLRHFDEKGKTSSYEFEQWLFKVLQQKASVRHGALKHWEEAPYARQAHPQEDHLLPLWVALGAAHNGQVSRVSYQNNLMGSITAASYRFD